MQVKKRMIKDEKRSGARVISNSIIYAISGLLLKCFGFFLLPLYTAYLSTADYGVTSIATSFITTMSYVVAFSLFSAVMRFYVDLKDDREKLKRFYGTIILFTFLSGVFFAIVFTAFRSVVSKYFFSGIDYYPVIMLCLITLIFSCQHTIYDNILKSQLKALKSSILSILYFFVNLTLNILFVVILKKQAVGVVAATMISAICYTVYLVIDMVKTQSISFCIDLKLLKEALAYSIPIMPHNLSTNIAELVSKVLIGGSSTLGSVGIYSIAAQFGNISDTIQVYINNAYAPWLYETLHSEEKDFKRNINHIVNFMAAIIGLFMIGISLFAQDYIFLFLKESYRESWKFVPLIVGVYTIKIPYYFYVNVLFYYKEASRKLFLATLSSSLINVFLSAFFIPRWGVPGSIGADAISMFVRVAIIVIISSSYDDVGLKIRDFIGNILIVALFIVAGLSYSWINNLGGFDMINFLFKIGMILLYLAVLFIRYRRIFVPTLKRVVVGISRKWEKR